VLIACTSPPDVLEMPSRVPVPPRQANFPETNRAAIGTPGSSDEEVEGEVDTDAKKRKRGGRAVLRTLRFGAAERVVLALREGAESL
jgi:hypothetical protein